MSFFLRLRLWWLAQKVQPSSTFLNTLEERLFPRQQILTMHRLRALRFAVVPALLVISLLGGTGVYAYSSDQVLPGNALYPLRQSLEGVAVQIAAVTPMKDRVRLRLLERHAREKKLLEEKQAKVKVVKPAQTKVVPPKATTTSTKPILKKTPPAPIKKR